jgi:hypothetical protein
MSVFSRILDYMRHGFTWKQPQEALSTPTRSEPRRPAERDWTDSLTVNASLTKGLYHNSYPGMKLAGGLAFAPIIMPVLFMGLPVPEPVDPEDEKTKEVCQQVLDAFSKDIKQIHIESHRDGTCWIWPHYSAKNKELVWEFIPDDTISDIFRDLSTGHIVKIMTDEEIKITVAENTVVTVRRKRVFTETLVTESWVSGTSMLPAELQNKTFTNVSGILPIPFSNNSDGDEVRGHSDYERIVTDLKDYHDIDLKTSVMWTKFNIKQIQEVEDVEKWREANGLKAPGALQYFDISERDLIFNLAGKEKTTYIFPTGALEAGERRLVTKFRKIVESSLIPELAWGVKVEGNMASADKQIEGMVMYVNDKREQKNEPYKKLFQASIQLLNIANMRREAPAIKITWNKLDAISELTKAQIFQALMTGIAQIMGTAGITKQILYNIVKKNYPEATQETLDEFILGLSDMAQFKQYVSATYTDVYDMQNGITPEEPPAPGEPPVDGAPQPGAEPLPAEQQKQIDGPNAQT